MTSSAKVRLAAGLFFALHASTALAGPRADLVRDWLTASSFGLPVTIGAVREEPRSQSVVLENVVIGDLEKDFVTIVYPTLTVEDPRRTPTGDFAAHAIRIAGMKADVRLDMEHWVPDLAALSKANDEGSDPMVPDGGQTEDDAAGGNAADGNGATADGATPDEPATAEKPPVARLSFQAETFVVERFVSPFASPTFDAKASSFDKAIAIARWSTRIRTDWAEYTNADYDTTDAAGGTTKVSYGSIYLSGMHDGRIERSGAKSIEETIAANGTDAKVTIGETSTRGADIGAYLDAFDPAAYVDGKGDGRWHTLVAEAGYRDIRVEFDGGVLAVGDVTTTGARIRQTPKPAMAIFQALFADPKLPERDPLAFARDVLPNVTGLFGFDQVKVTDISVDAPDDITFRLGEIAVDQADADGIGAITFRNGELKAGEAGSGSLNLVTLGNLKFGSLGALLSLADASKTAEGPSPQAMMDAVLDGSPTLDFLEVAGLAIETPQGNLGLDSFAITEGDWYKALARRYDLSFSRAFLPVAMITDPDAKEQLTAMGYDQVAVSGAATMTWDTDKGDVHLEDATVKVADMGVLSGDVHLGNLPLSIFLDPATIEARMQEGTLVSGSIGFGNAGVVERAFEVQAKKLNQKPDDFRKSVGDAMPLMLGFLDDQRIQQKFADVLKTFLNDPQSIVLTLAPTAPLPFSALAAIQTEAPGEVLDLLKVDVKANE
ncbi:hypothetical protein [Oharaeibacter diazotrophicus]|uniref:AsmA-like protein n=1 Tax=Oharaeibacter diazotrophicus TaxID=1920512 RepID=A0A4R6RL92_9HYPH|nr:hypothetical protein [Oharaeibacter diazotrophicus]TDP87403.1 hypothetical protein EDD54_1297 [Oharaeibacter diazotrophicus]BBE70654.1 hypothetical protein OHA_1_00218 [Pleomorphomonas sp. SM30]